ncbi:MAG TPA: methyltransferase domain-containing protein, partial [Acidimicrobiales bacterium]|nr:methyltransferase domain-containing protein [Acidimicrobiales bacterium]
MDTRDAAAAIAEQPLWYHTIDVAPGVATPGWFDLRPIVDRIPWPDLTGKRCLDVATYDGFLAFELERRGAAEVWATDVASHEGWDWLPRVRALGPAKLAEMAGQKGRGFEIAAELLGSKVQRKFVNVYDLHPDDIGTFDVVVCGSLLLHLRDPMRALEAIRRVCHGVFLSIEQIDVISSVVLRRRPTMFVLGDRAQWAIPNASGHRQMLKVAGFDLISHTKPFAEPFGVGHPTFRRTPRWMLQRAFSGGIDGVPTAAVLCRP